MCSCIFGQAPVKAKLSSTLHTLRLCQTFIFVDIPNPKILHECTILCVVMYWKVSYVRKLAQFLHFNFSPVDFQTLSIFLSYSLFCFSKDKNIVYKLLPPLVNVLSNEKLKAVRFSISRPAKTSFILFN